MNIDTVNELIQSLESAGELSVKEQKYLDLAKAYADKEAESVAQALTFEKCRELSGCPAGVDLQDWVKQLAAENATMKSNAIKARQVIMSSKFDYWSDRVELFEVVRLIIETPATDRIVAGIKADGVDIIRNALIKFVEDEVGRNDLVPGLIRGAEVCVSVADSLREGADK